MRYVKHQQGHVTHLINLDGIRLVTCITANPAGGAPRADIGRITYTDGVVLEVSLGCAKAVQGAFMSKTVQNAQPKIGAYR
jgi:hypothetical protein